MTVRVLVVDDSALARKLISAGLSADPGIEVVGVASSATAAWAQMQRLRPDVVTLDVEMEPVDGVTFLRQFMAAQPTATVIVSAHGQRGTKTSVEALNAGAVFVVAKPSGSQLDGLQALNETLCKRVKDAAKAKIRRSTPVDNRAQPKKTEPDSSPSRAQSAPPEIIGIGTSTGGAAALTRILPMFPATAPPIVIVDHMPAGFTREFAESLNARCGMKVREASGNELVEPGLVFVAPGGTAHLTVVRVGGRLETRLVEGPAANGHLPSVDMLFRSLIKACGRRTAAVLMTGMGRDGAAGLLGLHRCGAVTFAQNAATCVVFGMPKAAIELGAAKFEVSLDDIPARLLACS